MENERVRSKEGDGDSGCGMVNGRWKSLHEGAFVRCFLSSLISGSLPATYFHVRDRYRHWSTILDPLFLFLFLFFFLLLSPSFFLSFCRNNLFAIEDARGGKKRGGLNLKKVGQKDGNEVNGLTKEKRKSMEISWNVCLNWFGFARFSIWIKQISPPPFPLSLCSYAVSA